MTDQPLSSTPTPTPASSPADISPTQPGAPGAQPQPTTPTPGSAPQDPYAGYGHLDYESLMAEHEIRDMTTGEMQTYFPPAHMAIREFGGSGLQDALETYGIGNDKSFIVGLGRFGQDLVQLRQNAREVNTKLATLAGQLGQRSPRLEPPAPLSGQRLDTAIAKWIARYLPDTRTRGYEASGFANDPGVRRSLEAAVQEAHRLEQSLSAAGGLLQQMQGQWDAPEALRQLPDGRRYTKAELQASYGEVFAEWMAADKRGDLAAKARLKQQLEKVGKAAFS
jgi:hypothetical protein